MSSFPAPFSFLKLPRMTRRIALPVVDLPKIRTVLCLVFCRHILPRSFLQVPSSYACLVVTDRVMVGAGALGLHRHSQMWMFGCQSIAPSLLCNSLSTASSSGSWTSALILRLLSWAPINVWCLVCLCCNYPSAIWGKYKYFPVFQDKILHDSEGLDKDKKLKVPLFLLKWVKFLWEGRQTLSFL